MNIHTRKLFWYLHLSRTMAKGVFMAYMYANIIYQDQPAKSHNLVRVFTVTSIYSTATNCSNMNLIGATYIHASKLSSHAS